MPGFVKYFPRIVFLYGNVQCRVIFLKSNLTKIQTHSSGDQSQNPKMRKRIGFDILKQNQLKVQNKPNLLQESLYRTSYQLVNDLLIDIKRPFKNICIHGYYPNFMMDYLTTHRKQILNVQNPNSQDLNGMKDEQSTITIVDYLDLFKQEVYPNQIFKTKLINVENSDQFPPQQEQFDLIISGLQLNHTNSQEKLLQKYLRTLKPDGAIIGCAMVQGTLSQLHWSYLMAQNQRYGGLSPKIMNLPSLGQLGSFLTTSHFHLTTVLNRDFLLEFDSPLQLMKTIQLLGQNNHLKGRRKAVYKQLLISMYALYQSQFSHMSPQQNTQKILSTLVLSPFVGWKYSPDQPKPLRRGQQGQSIDFIDQLRKYDPDLEHYRINQESDEPQQINPEKRNNNKDS